MVASLVCNWRVLEVRARVVTLTESVVWTESGALGDGLLELGDILVLIEAPLVKIVYVSVPFIVALPTAGLSAGVLGVGGVATAGLSFGTFESVSSTTFEILMGCL